MTEFKDRYRGLKAAMGDKDKQLDLAKRTIERLSGQCNAIEVTCHYCCQTHIVCSAVNLLGNAICGQVQPFGLVLG